MKKLALAFACLVSVAFFASCKPEITNPEPSIAIMTGEDFVYDGQTIDLNTNYKIGFRAASNSQTQKELSTLRIALKVTDLDDNVNYAKDTVYNVSGTEYVFQQGLSFDATNHRELVFKAEITATITDVDGKMNSTSVKLNVNQPEQQLEPKDFDWYRLGNTQTGLEEFGLYWERNAKSPFAQIKPLEGVTLYKFETSVWEATTTDIQKAALFSDAALTVSVYNNVDVNANATYDDVIGTRMEDGTLHLINVKSCTIGDQVAQGRPIHILGKAK